MSSYAVMKSIRKCWSMLANLTLLALLISGMLHLILLIIPFRTLPIKAANFIPPQLQVVLVNSKSYEAPDHADFLAQNNLDGGGNTDDNRHAASPLPSSQHDQQQSDIAQAQKKVKQLEAENRQMMTQLKSAYTVPVKPTTAPMLASAPVAAQAGNADALALNLEMAQLQAQISQQYDAYQKRPRKMFIGARTREYAAASYVEDWRIKVERIGNVNYPAAAREQKIYGRLQLEVSIKADGSLEDLRILRSSGSPILDNAALNIVRMAAPFSPFPDELRKKTDVLDITRTWSFESGDQLSTQDDRP